MGRQNWRSEGPQWFDFRYSQSFRERDGRGSGGDLLGLTIDSQRWLSESARAGDDNLFLHRTTYRVPRPLSNSTPLRLRFDDFELDEANAWLLRGGKAVALAPTPFSLLCTLARQPDALLTKDALLHAVWGHRFVTESVLETAISDLRNALGDDAREPRFIKTAP